MRANIKIAYIFSTLLSILLFTASTSYSQGYTITELYYSDDGSQTVPDSLTGYVQMNNNGDVVWCVDYSPDSEIFLYDGSVRQLTDNDEYERAPQINDNGYVVWESWGSVSGADYEIWLYNGENTTQLTDNDSDQDDFDPQINDSGYVVWYGYDGSDYEIFLYDGSDVRQLTDNSFNDIYPQINNSGDVVWYGGESGNNEIWLYDGTDITQLTNNSYHDYNPRINNYGEVAWYSDDGLYYGVWLYDGTDTTLVQSNDLTKNLSNINDSGHIVWNEGFDTFLYDGLDVTQINDDSDSRNPQMNNSDEVVWSGGIDSNHEIWLYDGSTATQLTNTAASISYYPKINDSGHIAWSNLSKVYYAYPSEDGGGDDSGSDDGGGGDSGGDDDGGGDDGSDDGDDEDLPKAGVFGAISINDVIGYHLDAIKKDGTRIYMPVTKGYKALKGAQTHIESLSPAFADMIRGGFDSLEGMAEANKDGGLYWIGTHLFPSLGKIAELYLDAVDSEDLMKNAYSDTIISAAEFNIQRRKGIAVCPHVVKRSNK